MIELFNHKLESPDIVALSFLIIALGVLRVGLTFQQRHTERVKSIGVTEG